MEQTGWHVRLLLGVVALWCVSLCLSQDLNSPCDSSDLEKSPFESSLSEGHGKPTSLARDGPPSLTAALANGGASEDKLSAEVTSTTNVRHLMQLITSIAPREDYFVPAGDRIEPIARFLRDCLDGLAGRLLKLQAKKVDFDYADFKQQGCIAVSNISLNGVKGLVAIFPSAVLARLTLSVPHLSPFFQQQYQHPCITPIALAVHEKSASSLPPEGSFNHKGQCNKENLGGRHDPGLACGLDGSELCKTLNIPPFDEKTGERKKGASYKCDSSLYSQRPFSCHVGDLTGKYGLGVDASPSPLMVDLRLMAADERSDNPCNMGEQLLPVVISCHTSGRRLACAPLQVLGTTSPSTVISLLQELVLEATTALPRAPTVEEVMGGLKVAVELESRVKFLEAAVEQNPTKPLPIPPPRSSSTSTKGPTTDTQRSSSSSRASSSAPAPPRKTTTTSTTTRTATSSTAPYSTNPMSTTSTLVTSSFTTRSTASTTTHTRIPGPPEAPQPPRPPNLPPRRRRRPPVGPPVPDRPEAPKPVPAPPKPTPQPDPRPPTDPHPPAPPPGPNPPPRRRRRRPWDPEDEKKEPPTATQHELVFVWGGQ